MKVTIRRVFYSFLLGISAVFALFASEIFIAIKFGSSGPPFVNPNHAPITVGNSGPKLTYVVIGDSTGAGRGAAYADGIAMGTTRFLAQRYRVTMTNFSISGAIAADVLRSQVDEAAALKPDIVLLSVGANDATHFTSGNRLYSQLDHIIGRLRAASPSVRIVVTGCPQMGSVPRFWQPLRWFAGTQTDRINGVFAKVVALKTVTWSQIADRTGAAFAKDPSLFASDQFHPNDRGYALWIPVLDQSLDNALQSRPV